MKSKTRAFIITDVQNDFLPGGALAVPKGDEVIPVINHLSRHFSLVVATLDWHPPGHMSFASSHPGKKPGEKVGSQILWPDHCVQHSRGAALADALDDTAISARFLKGSDPAHDSYSAFFDNQHKRSTGLGDYLKEKGVEEVVIAGLATDYCILYSVLDALKLGFEVIVVKDGCRAINLKQDDEKKAYAQMREKGARLMTSQELAKELPDRAPY